MAEMAHLDMPIDPALKSRLAALAAATQQEESTLVSEALATFLDVQEWQRAQIDKGLAAADRGEFATDDEMARIRNKYKAS